MGRIFALSYSLDDLIDFGDVQTLFNSVKSKLNDDDELIVMPQTFQLTQLSVDQLELLSSFIQKILDSKKAGDDK